VLNGALQEAGVDYRVLGPLEIRDSDRSLAGATERALPALVLVNANHLDSRDRPTGVTCHIGAA